MKRIGLVAFIFAQCLIWQTINAQTFTEEQKATISETKKIMDEDEQQSLDDANNLFEEANYIINNVENEDLTLEKYFAKGSTPKAEKKAVNVKTQRIEANRQYANAYNMIYDAMVSRQKKLAYEFPDDKSKADDLILQANSKLTEASGIMDNYRFLEDKDLQTYEYETLKNQISESHKAFEDAIGLECEAINLYFAQEQRKASMGEEDIDWGTASAANTYDSYSEYLTKYPQGKYADDARQNLFVLDPDRYNAEMNPSSATEVPEGVVVETSQPVAAEETMIEGEVSNGILSGVASNPVVEEEEPVYSQPILETTNEVVETVQQTVEPIIEEPVYSQPILEETAAPAVAPVVSTPSANYTETSPAGVIYRVQIIAVARGELADATIKSIYSGSEPIHRRLEDGMYKYSVGEFTSFKAANEFRKSLSTEGFIVKFRDGKRVN